MRNQKNGFAYMSKCGRFFKQGERGSFSVHSKPYTKKELLTKDLSMATIFPFPLDCGSPYNERFLDGGKWVSVSICYSYKEI